MALSLTADASRRDFLRITGLGAVGLALAACGGGSERRPRAPLMPPPFRANGTLAQ
jgi:hypothetical protein